MRLKEDILKEKRTHTLKEEQKKKSRTFFDVPMGAKACNCGGKIIAQGKCQTCYNKFVEKFKLEADRMNSERATAEEDEEYRFLQNMRLIRI